MLLKPNVFLACLKAKIEEKLPNTFVKYFLDQKPFWPFLENKKNINKTLIFNFIFCNCSLMHKEGLCKFQKKILIFKVPVIFQKGKLCCACAAHPRGWTGWLFGFELTKKTPDQEPSISFKIRRNKNTKSLHPTA